mgnify:CR=1 FL=1
MLSQTIIHNIEQQIGAPIKQTRSVGGGCISETYILTTKENHSLFLKTQSQPTDMFLKESHGLNELQKAKCIRIPKVVHVSQNFLLLECINISHHSHSTSFFEKFGRQLAQLHRHTNEDYGFFEDNYIGSTLQKNVPQSKNWALFYFRNRVLFQYKLAGQHGYATPEFVRCFLNLEKKVENILGSVNETASLLHGDLWSGNFLVDENDDPVLIDPAAYYGHRETDLAMTKLFGGFPDAFYHSYREEFPPLDGWEEREPLYQLYHILNHLNLFGTSYYNQAIALMKVYM